MKIVSGLMGLAGIVMMVMGVLKQDVIMVVSGSYLIMSMRLDEIQETLNNGAVLKISSVLKNTSDVTNDNK